MDSGDLDTWKPEEEEAAEKPETKTGHDEEQRMERSKESTVHTVPELLTQVLKVP